MSKILSPILVCLVACIALSAFSVAEPLHYRLASDPTLRGKFKDGQCMDYASLRRLRTDRIDLYQVHWPDPLVRIEDTAETLLELQREGKILALGVSNYSPEQMGPDGGSFGKRRLACFISSKATGSVESDGIT
jgi:hypothetical protein